LKRNKQDVRNFSEVQELCGDKAVTELAGIGETLGGRLTEAGFDKAYTVLEQYLVLKKDEELFKDCIKEVCHVSFKQASDCLNDWCEEFL
ncbi:hypothetical protein KR032_001511, partial [Drosophila birchii]